jgi:two-component system cell cycle sensor histidine kinase/response regulator CckA
MDQVLINLCLHVNETLSPPHRLLLRVRRTIWEGQVWGQLEFSQQNSRLSQKELHSHLTPPPSYETHEGRQLELWTLPKVVGDCGGRFSARVRDAQAHFEVSLMAERGPTPAPFNLPEGEAQSTRDAGVTVFLCDDDRDVQRTISRALKRQGYKVQPFLKGEDCLDALAQRAQPPALLISDVLMPHMRGPELVTRARELFPTMPVLYLSGYLETEGLDLGAQTHFLQKPFSLDNLEETVAKLCQ